MWTPFLRETMAKIAPLPNPAVFRLSNALDDCLNAQGFRPRAFRLPPCRLFPQLHLDFLACRKLPFFSSTVYLGVLYFSLMALK